MLTTVAGAEPIVTDGMSGGRPNLFLIGAMKSGTNYLRKLLHAHPSIFMCEPGEPSYFVEPQELKAIWAGMWDRGFWRSEQNYLNLFRSAGDATILGEASTSYTKQPYVTGVAERIKTFNPDARLIYVMRDPIERTLSHYWHMVRYHAEHRPMIKAIQDDQQYTDISHYAMQLMPYFERFGDDRIEILTYENLVREPVAVMGQLYSWLGVGSDGVDMTRFDEPENVTPEIVRLPHRWSALRWLRQSPQLRAILRSTPHSVQKALRGAADRDVLRQDVATTEAIEFLRPIQRRQTEELSQVLGREFPEWKTLNG